MLEQKVWSMTKPTKWSVHAAKISLGIHPDWSGSLLCTFSVPNIQMLLHVNSEDSHQNERINRLIWIFAGCTGHFVGFVMLQLILLHKTRAVRGSDYSPATALSEEKDKLVTEIWRDREKTYHRIIPKPHAHLHSMQKISAKFQNNWWKSVRGVAPTRYPLSIHFDSISCQKRDKVYKAEKVRKNKVAYQNQMNVFISCRKYLQSFKTNGGKLVSK